MKSAVFWDVTPCGSCKNRQLLVTANAVSSSPIPVALVEAVPPKRQFLQLLHDITSQKTAFFIDTGVKNSNLT
jgi:hypothetical protein